MNSLPPVLLTFIAGLKTHDMEQIAASVADDFCLITPVSTVKKERYLSFLRALYTAFPDWHYDHDEPEMWDEVIAIKWRQGGTHTEVFALPGLTAVTATGKKVRMPEQFFFYRVRGNQIIEIRPDPIPGGVPQGILDKIGVQWPSS